MLFPFPERELSWCRLVLQVKIMKEWDPKGKIGPKTPLPDVVTVHQPKEDELMAEKPFVGKEMEMAA